METQVLAEFRALTKSLLTPRQRQQLQLIITNYKETENFSIFFESLKRIIIRTDHCRLLPFLRLFLLKKHKSLAGKLSENEFISECSSLFLENQASCNRSVELHKGPNDIIVITIKKGANESLGIGIRGGNDYGCGIFVSDLQPGSAAARAGVKLGDQILYANNFKFEGIDTTQAAKLLASTIPAMNSSQYSKLKLVFSRAGVIPVQRSISQRIAWFNVESGSTILDNCGDSESSSNNSQSSLGQSIIIKSTISLAIRGGKDFGVGVFVAAVGVGNQLEGPEIHIGDEIARINGHNLNNFNHSEAVQLLRKQKHLTLFTRTAGKYPLYKEITSEVTWLVVDSYNDLTGETKTTVTRSVKNELPWETVITIRRRSEQRCPLPSGGSKSMSNTITSGPRLSNSGHNTPFSLTKSSSSSLIIDTGNATNPFQKLFGNSGSIRSCAGFSMHGSSIKGQKTTKNSPVSIINADNFDNSTAFNDSAIGKPNGLSRTNSWNKISHERIGETNFSNEAIVRSPSISSFAKIKNSIEHLNQNSKRPSLAVKGLRTILIKLPKRPETSLGLGVSGGGDSPENCLRIDHALPDSIAGEAAAEGILEPGCLLLAVDGHSLVGSSHEEAVAIIRRCFRDVSKSTLNLLISR